MLRKENDTKKTRKRLVQNLRMIRAKLKSNSFFTRTKLNLNGSNLN